MLYEKDGKLYRRWDKEILCIEPYGPNALRVRATHLAGLNDDFSALEPADAGPPPVIQIDGDTASIANGDIRCEVLCTGKLKFYNGRGDLLVQEYDKNRFRKNAPGELDSALEIIPRTFVPHRGTNYFKLQVRFEAQAGERFYGMGQYQQPDLNLKGCVLELAQRNSQVSVPFCISSKGYGFFWNNPAIGHAAFVNNVTMWQAESTRQMDYWITAADTPRELVESYAKVVSRVPMMPDYALGLWQSKLRYRTQQEVLEVAREYRRRGVPLSVIVIDFFHWTAQGDWKFDPECWPNPGEMVRELEEMGVKLMVSVWPTVEEGSENFAFMQEAGLLIRTEAGPRVCIKNRDTYADMTNPDTRAFVWDKLKRNYYDHGIRLFWLDEGEPETTKYEFDNYRYHIGSALEAGPLYPREYTRMVYEGMRAEGKENVITLARCGWPGSQKYGAILWTGDVSSSFDSLRNQLAAALGMGISGMPWWTTDIGGFVEGDVRSDEFKELLVHWFQMGTFCPVLRMHGFRNPIEVTPGGKPYTAGDATGWKYTSGAPNEIWSYGEAVYDICTTFIRLRERIKPYLREQMRAAHERGTPIMRPLFFDYPEDAAAANIEDQYMFGPDVMVAPVMELGVRIRTVYFPEGVWRHIFSGIEYSGPATAECAAPLEEVPVFVKAERAVIFDAGKGA
ncbi:MAG: hypothetical protein LUE17_09580 [Planctomycetaceae bacterium]|nr:hypothetical protein [Planctomycetaceae bacterium]